MEIAAGYIWGLSLARKLAGASIRDSRRAVCIEFRRMRACSARAAVRETAVFRFYAALIGVVDVRGAREFMGWVNNCALRAGEDFLPAYKADKFREVI